MPLENGSSKQVISHNIEEMQNSGHPHNQAVAAALHNAKDEELGFKKLESKVAAGGASDPAAVAAKIGREKYGQREMTAKSEAGKAAKDADIGNPNHDPKNGQFASGHVVAVNKQSGKKTQLTSTPVTAPEAKTIISKQSDASNKVNNYEHHVALKPADGEQRHVAGNKVYPSAEHAIKAANAEHAKSGLILGVEKYDPQKHPTALPARGKGSAAHAANEKEKAFQKQWPNGGTVARKDGGYPRGAGSEKQGKENHSALRNKVAANRGAEAAAEFEGPVKADPAKERLMSKGKRDDDEKAAAQRHELNKPASSGKNGYVGFYKGKRAEVHADTSYEAQQKLAKMLGAKKAHEVSFGLAEKDGQQVTHTAVDAQPGMVTQQNSGVPAWKGKNLDDNPVGDSYGSGDCAASPDAAAWPGRVL